MLAGKYNLLLASKRIVLASQSARRRSILVDLLNLSNIETIPSNAAEDIDKNSCGTPEKYVEQTCLQKIHQSMQQMEGNIPDILIGADTIVVLNNRIILEKPTDPQHAIEMLSMLSNQTHQVMTAVGIAFKHPNSLEVSIEVFVEKTEVTMSKLSQECIELYSKSDIPYDKAGGYGIQSYGGSSFISSITGCYYNVMGFPINAFCQKIIHLIDSGKLK